MPKEHSSSRRKRFAIWLPVALLLLFGAYQTVMYVVRRQVDGRIAAVVGKPLFDFELTDRDGRVFRSRELRGKVVVLNFFRSKCAGCVAERDAVRALVDRVDPAEVRVLGVMMDAVQGFTTEVTEKTLRAFDYRHPVLMADAAFMDAFHGSGWSHVTPVTYIVDREGVVRASLRGHQELATFLEALPAGSLK